MAYEVATFRALREMLRCKEIWVVGAGRYRNPDDDLPKDFEARRGDYHQERRKPPEPPVVSRRPRGGITAAPGKLKHGRAPRGRGGGGERAPGLRHSHPPAPP